jgi:hypothetical protein
MRVYNTPSFLPKTITVCCWREEEKLLVCEFRVVADSYGHVVKTYFGYSLVNPK